MAAFNPRFLVVSIGNMEPYSKSLHSAGHFALESLQRALGPTQPPLQRTSEHRYRQSRGFPYALMMSPKSMNISGKWVKAVYKEYLAEHNLKPTDLALVVLHDELEEAFGVVKVRKWQASHRGHNGIKSILSTLKPLSSSPSQGLNRWHRISVGIDRPLSRDPHAVADYVLGNLDSQQLGIIDRDVGPRVLECLEGIRADWIKSHAQSAQDKA
ncbi:peptidyl-tRNA hydrolase [Microdochium bolleyi]|uniref:peptidyl-tRNA hydrolase n=1 Tax=Microdochium bolleyi TaxID=196109 RepID=A0A136J5T2_9PEZI|nr:peptidyl-tRNA hydrolase [Microdochium bolleyi]